MIKTVKKGVLAILFLCLFQFAFSNGVAETTNSENSVKWTLSYLKKSNNSVSSLAVDSLASLKKGDTFKVIVKPNADVFCYVIDELPNGNVSVLYSGSVEENQNKYFPGPNSSAWFDEKIGSGISKIHIVVSSEPQANLETLISAVQKNGASKANSNSLLDEISRLKKDNSKIAMTPVKPASVGASTRSISGTDFAPMNSSSSSATNNVTNTEFSGNMTYAKTLRIKY